MIGVLQGGLLPLAATRRRFSLLSLQPYYLLQASKLTGLNNGDPVTTYTDLSGHGSPTQATPAYRPTYDATGGPNGTPTVRFNGSAQQYLSVQFGAPVLQPTTEYIAVGFSAPGNQVVQDGFDGSARQKIDISSAQFRIESGTPQNVHSAIIDTGLPNPTIKSCLYRIEWAGASSRVYRNGVDIGALPGSPGAGGLGGLTLGTYYGHNQLFLYGDISLAAEFPQLSAANRAKAEAYIYQTLKFPTNRRVVCYGDSTVWGWAGGATSSQVLNPWPKQLKAALEARDGVPWDVINLGVPGKKLIDPGGRSLTQDAPSRLGPEYSPVTIKTDVIIQGMINDMLGGGVSDPNVILGGVASEYNEAKKWYPGCTVIGTTGTPSQAAGTPVTYESTRQAVNAALRAATPGTYFDILADVGGDPTIGTQASTLDTSLYWDKVHRTDLGYSYDTAVYLPLITP
ncbi:MAG: SGNH/GDSL hydrolase family protein [Actinomycetota bacterium]|nr:SGNH/GDSL hydrolase family protein [Actinomycetota bacterium]